MRVVCLRGARAAKWDNGVLLEHQGQSRVFALKMWNCARSAHRWDFGLFVWKRVFASARDRIYVKDAACRKSKEAV